MTMKGFKDVPCRLTLLNEDEKGVGETIDCLVDWAAGPTGHLVNLISPGSIRIPDGESVKYVELRDEDGHLFWVFPIVGGPTTGDELVLSERAYAGRQGL
jgi:hypothetical protein